MFIRNYGIMNARKYVMHEYAFYEKTIRQYKDINYKLSSPTDRYYSKRS